MESLMAHIAFVRSFVAMDSKMVRSLFVEN